MAAISSHFLLVLKNQESTSIFSLPHPNPSQSALNNKNICQEKNQQHKMEKSILENEEKLVSQ